MDEYKKQASTVRPSPLHHPDVFTRSDWRFLEPEAVTASQCLRVEKINYFNSTELGKLGTWNKRKPAVFIQAIHELVLVCDKYMAQCFI